MNVSVDDEPDEDQRAREVLASWLDDYAGERCEREDLREAFADVCSTHADAPWDALALLDQYQRRGRLDGETAQVLKADIEKIAFRARAPGGPARTSRPAAPSRRPEPRVAPPEPDEEEEDDEPREPIRPLRAHRGRAPDIAPPPASDTGGWKRLTPERESDSTRPGTAFIDRTRLRDEFAVHTQPRVAPREQPAMRRRSAASARSEQDAPRQVLRDRYELISELDRDSTGVLYYALDRRRSELSVAARYVAVKTLSRDYRNPTALAELQREFHQAQTLAHPNIVSVFDLDCDQDRYFVVMELLQGALLSDVFQALEGQPMRRAHALTIISGVGAALAYAHRREIVHGDLKPENVMITENGEIRVLEFGFARRRAFQLHSASESDVVAPTSAYASAERVNGAEPEPSDDVYSLACIAYELLSGRHPFEGRTASRTRTRKRPPRIAGLERRQMQTLERALLWTHGERRVNASELLAALGCSEAGAGLVTPDEILEPQARGAGWGRALGVAALIAAVSAAVIYFGPRIALRQADVAATAAPAAVAADPTPSPAQAPQPQPQAATPTPAEPSPAPTRVASAETERSQPVVAERSEPADGAGRPALAFDQESYVVRENEGVARLQVVRTGSAQRALTFTWTLHANSARAGEDFADLGSGVERIPAGVRRTVLTVPLVSDSGAEPTEMFLVDLQLEDGVQATLGERSSATVIIVDDD